MKCPSCPADISDFLQNPQVNRELMDLIESLQSKTDENIEESVKNVELREEDSDSADKAEGVIEDTEKAKVVMEDAKKAEVVMEHAKKAEVMEQAKEAEVKIEDTKATTEDSEIPGVKEIQENPIDGKHKQNNKQKKVNSSGKNTSGVNKNIQNGTINSEMAKSDMKNLQTPKTEIKPEGTSKRRKANDGNHVLGTGGVRTRSVRPKELVDGENDSPSSPLKVNHVSRTGGVRTRSMRSKALVDGNDSPSSPLHVQSDDDFE